MPIFRDQRLMYEVIENMKTMLRVIDSEENVIYMNRSMRKEFGDQTGKKCYEMLCRHKKCDDCISIKCKKSKEAESKDIAIGDRNYRIISSPAKVQEKEGYSIEFFHNITEQKKLEKKFTEHYEKLKDDIAFAKQIQREVLPRDGNYWNAIKINFAYSPSEDLSGDLFDIVKIDDDKCLFYIADVSGHGVRSSLLTMFIRQVIRGMKAEAVDMIALLDELIKNYHDLNMGKEQYISVLCGLYNKETKGLSLINAGHNCLPIVLENSKKENIVKEIKVTGMPICSLLFKSNHEIKTLQMEKGDRILLYTDGVTESYNPTDGKPFGIDGLRKVIDTNGNREGMTLANQIIQEAKNFAGTSLIDDMAAVTIDIL